MKRRTVVMIDDIDRLNAAETRQIFQLVKLTARFPYVTYVLAFDRSAVASALEGVGVDSGEEYLEKIVQVSFDLPPISDATLSSFITEGIDLLLAKYKPAHFDMHRFGNMFHGGFRSAFSSVRHVRRFLNGLEFSLSLIGNELNGVDVIGVEALKTFYPHIFEVVKNNQDLFAGHNDTSTQKLGAPEYRKKLDGLLTATGELNEDSTNLLIELFPKLEYAYSTTHTMHGHEWEREWEKAFRVATARYFSAYFQLTLAPSEVSLAELSQLISESGNTAMCSQHLRALAAQGKLKATMDSLRFRLQEVPPESLQLLLAALIGVGDIASESGAIFAGRIPEYFHVRWAIFDTLDRVPATSRPGVLLDIAHGVLAPRTMVNVVSLIEELRQKENKYPEFTDDRLNELKEAVAARISAAAAGGEISIVPDSLTTLLYAWRKWGDPKAAEAYVKSLTDTDEKLAAFLNKFIYQTHSAGLGDHAMTTHNRLAMKQLSESMDLGTLRERLDTVDVLKMSEADRDVVSFAKSQLDKMLEKSLTPEQFDNNRFYDD
jgi:predicted KAP-like P-loop ATPase